MSRRTNIIIQDSITANAHHEREAAQEHTTRLQKEAENLGSIKKALEKHIDDTKSRSEEELHAHRAAVDTEIQKETRKLQEIQNHRIGLESEIATLIEHIDTLRKHHGTLKAVIAETEPYKVSLEHAIRELTTSKQITENDVKNTRAEKHRLGDEIHTLQAEIINLESTKTQLTADVSHLLVEINGHNEATTGIHKKTQTLQTDIATAKEELAKIRNELQIAFNKRDGLQQQVIDFKTEMQRREDEINEKMGNLSRLDIHITEKVQLFKEAKSHFTSEQLLRMGIRD